MLLRRLHPILLIFALALVPANLFAKDKHPKPTPQDGIAVIGHLAIPGGAVVRFLTTQHYHRNYLYAEQEAGSKVTLVDITDIRRPMILAQMVNSGGLSNDLVAAVGNAALVEERNGLRDAQPEHQNFQILSFADPLHPKVEREFANVTAIARDDSRGLIFLANSDGIWILQQQFAMDPQFEKQWEHMMLDAR